MKSHVNPERRLDAAVARVRKTFNPNGAIVPLLEAFAVAIKAQHKRIVQLECLLKRRVAK